MYFLSKFGCLIELIHLKTVSGPFSDIRQNHGYQANGRASLVGTDSDMTIKKM